MTQPSPAEQLRTAYDSCPGYEMKPSPCRCPCYGCKHHCSAHNPEPHEDQPEPAQPRHTADSITDTALDQLYADLAEAQRQVTAWKTRAGIRTTQRRRHERRAERAEAALNVFRDHVQAITDEARGGIREQLGTALAALDAHTTPTETR